MMVDRLSHDNLNLPTVTETDGLHPILKSQNTKVRVTEKQLKIFYNQVVEKFDPCSFRGSLALNLQRY